MTSRFVALTPSLYLLEQAVPKPVAAGKAPLVLPNSNHIFLADVSGSMHYSLYQLGEDIIERYSTLPVGDTVTFGWFSSPGDYRFVIKGFRITGNVDDFKVFAATVRQNMRSRGTTCFSEILLELPEVIRDLKAFGPIFSLAFFTDGYPVVPNYASEIANIRKATGAVSGMLTSVLIVGYGNYYNKQLLVEMAEQFCGTLIHAKDLPQFNLQMGEFLTGVKDLEPCVEVDLENTDPLNGLVFSVQERNVVLLDPHKGRVMFTPYKAKENFLYTLSTTRPTEGNEVTMSDNEVTSGGRAEAIVKAVYAAALLMSQRCKVNTALDLLAKTGDVAAIDAINSAYTNDEYGRAEAILAASISGPAKRFAKGRQMNYLPDPNAFCMLDLIDLLKKDDAARVWPRHEAFNYNLIGAQREKLEGTLEFTHTSDNLQVPLDGLVWNQKMLNLSIRVQIPGTVALPAEKAKSLGLAENYPTFIWRAYTLIKDGFLNLDTLPVSVSQETFQKLQHVGVIANTEVWDAEFKNPVILDLTAIPVMNRAIGDGKDKSAVKLCKMSFREQELEAIQKVLNARVKELTEMAPAPKSFLPLETEAWLEINGITRNGFSPKEGSTIKTGDFYMAKEFEIKIKGLSSWPKLSDVTAKTAKIKEAIEKKAAKVPEYTVSQLLIKAGMDIADKLIDPSVVIEKAKVETQLTAVKEELFKLRRAMRETMFSIILGNHWFDELTSREESTLEIDDNTFTISLREVQVDL
jgi:hypothetical protein